LSILCGRSMEGHSSQFPYLSLVTMFTGKRKWAFDFCSCSRPFAASKTPLLQPFGSDANLSGLTADNRSGGHPQRIDNTKLKMEKAWETAKTPFKSMFMFAFMLYMTPNTPSLVPLSITIYTIFSPLRAIFTVNSIFSSFSDDKNSMQLLLPKLVFVTLNLLVIALALWKIWKFGLLPMTAADWILHFPVNSVSFLRVYLGSVCRLTES
jgi:hypothetical protein